MRALGRLAAIAAVTLLVSGAVALFVANGGVALLPASDGRGFDDDHRSRPTEGRGVTPGGEGEVDQGEDHEGFEEEDDDDGAEAEGGGYEPGSGEDGEHRGGRRFGEDRDDWGGDPEELVGAAGKMALVGIVVALLGTGWKSLSRRRRGRTPSAPGPTPAAPG